MAAAVPDYCAPILGWRVWSVADGIAGPRLLSAFSTFWPSYEALVAEHKYAIVWGQDMPPPCPGLLCAPADDNPGCGIYAYKTNEYLRWRAANVSGPGVAPLILGQVALWGTVVEHVVGYRATLAYPHRFVYAHHCDGQQIAQTYGVAYQEDPSWKSALRSDASPWSPFRVPSQNAIQIVNFPPIQVRLPPPPRYTLLPNLPANLPSPPVSDEADDDPATWVREYWQKLAKALGL